MALEYSEKLDKKDLPKYDIELNPICPKCNHNLNRELHEEFVNDKSYEEGGYSIFTYDFYCNNCEYIIRNIQDYDQEKYDSFMFNINELIELHINWIQNKFLPDNVLNDISWKTTEIREFFIEKIFPNLEYNNQYGYTSREKFNYLEMYKNVNRILNKLIYFNISSMTNLELIEFLEENSNNSFDIVEYNKFSEYLLKEIEFCKCNKKYKLLKYDNSGDISVSLYICLNCGDIVYIAI